MKALSYLIRKSIKNFIKDLKNKPGTLIMYLFFIALMILVLVSATFSKTRPQSSIALAIDIFGIVTTIIILFFFFLTLLTSTNSGGALFRNSDVNFLFVSPLRPQQILMYGFIKQVYKSLLVSVFIIFQYQILKMSLGISVLGVITLMLIFALLMFVSSILSVLIYCIGSIYPWFKKAFPKIIYCLIALVIGGFAYTYLKNPNILEALKIYFNSKVFEFVPMIGWIKVITLSVQSGFSIYAAINLVLIMATIALMVFIIYSLNLDFYEDVLDTVGNMEEIITLKKSGNASFQQLMNANKKSKKKIKKIKFKYKVSGARAIVYRQILERRKTGFLLLSKMSLILAFGAGVFCYANRKTPLFTVMFFMVYMLFIFSAQGRWVNELGKPFIYLIPDNPRRKMFYASLADILTCFIEGVVIFSVAGIITKTNPFVIILVILCYTSFGMLFNYSDVLCRRMFGGVHSKQLFTFVKMLVMLILVGPIIAVSVIIGVITNMNFMYPAIIALNILVSFIMLILGAGLFENVELND